MSRSGRLGPMACDAHDTVAHRGVPQALSSVVQMEDHVLQVHRDHTHENGNVDVAKELLIEFNVGLACLEHTLFLHALWQPDGLDQRKVADCPQVLECLCRRFRVEALAQQAQRRIARARLQDACGFNVRFARRQRALHAEEVRAKPRCPARLQVRGNGARLNHAPL